MEDTLRGPKNQVSRNNYSLNPCFNGRYSQSTFLSFNTFLANSSLNPCFNGRYSQSYKSHGNVAKGWGLNPCFNGRYSQR